MLGEALRDGMQISVKTLLGKSIALDLAAEFMPKYVRLASQCLEKSEEFFNSLCLEAEDLGATLQWLEAHGECFACVSSSAFAC